MYTIELMEDMNKWSNAEKAACLAIYLRNAVATVLTNLTPRSIRTNSHFGIAHQKKLNRKCLKARTCHRKETLVELANDFEHLANLEAAEAMVEVLAQDYVDY